MSMTAKSIIYQENTELIKNLSNSNMAKSFCCGSLITSVAGVVISLACSATALKVVGVALVAVGIYSFTATLACLKDCDKENTFNKKISNYLIMWNLIGATELIEKVSQIVLCSYIIATLIV